VRAQRRLLLFLAVLAAAVAVLQPLAGGAEVVLYAAPALLLLGLLLSDRLPGESWILARRSPPGRPRRRLALRHWTHDRDRALASLIERSPRLLRGPPAAPAARC
jgi:hypothetical protein